MGRHMSNARPRRTARWTLAAAAVALLPTTGWAAGAFDSASSRAGQGDVRRLTWTHVLAGGANRVGVVGVTLEDKERRNEPPQADPVVEFNHVPMFAVPGGTATAIRQSRILRTQLFYLLDASLPGAGSYPV